MIIVVRSALRAEAELSAGELSGLGLTYEELDYADIRTRKVLSAILDEIKRSGAAKTDFSGRLLIEVMKKRNGNILISFTALSSLCGRKSLKQLIKSTEDPLILEADIERLCAAASAAEIKYPCSLYEKDGVYRLAVHADAGNKNLLAALLSEFGEIKVYPRLEYARCNENWRLIAKDNALSVLSLIG